MQSSSSPTLATAAPLIPAGDSATPRPASPDISIHVSGDAEDGSRPPLAGHSSAPPAQTYKSPLRQHKRTPSQHREVKYTNDDWDGHTHHRINQYTIKQEIGRGSYGDVHLATDQYGNEYAVKEFSKTRLRRRAKSNILRHGPRRPIRFPEGHGLNAPLAAVSEPDDALFLIREEIAIMKKLNHPNLVQLIEVLDDPDEDSLYMVLEMCKKGVIMKVGIGETAEPYEEEQCRYWFRDLILGIEYLHAQGVIHRDIKPDNLLLTDDDVLKIVDFGVSEMFEKEGSMRTAKSAGSPAFLAPELCMSRHGDVSGKAADIWSMGVSLYCLRYGRIPFEHEGVLEMYDAIRNEDVKMPPDEDADFADLMHKLLEKNPDKRITMAELREHPWVTRRGSDPLLSAEQNCDDFIEAPNALEVNHAFTRRMSHLLCVMKAIQKFKSLLPPKEERAARGSSPGGGGGSSSNKTSRQSTAQSKTDSEYAERAAALVEARMKLLRTASGHEGSGGQRQQSSSSSSSPSQQDHHAAAGAAADPRSSSASPQQPVLLGIGTGSQHDDFAAGARAGARAADDGAVSESPTAVDFDVYDQAYGAEVRRIRSQSRKTRMYLTRHLQSKDSYRGDEDIEAGGSGGGGGGGGGGKWGTAAAVLRGDHDDGEEGNGREEKEGGEGPPPEPRDPKAADYGVDPGKAVSRSHRFANLVTQTIKDSKAKITGSGGGGESEESEDKPERGRGSE
ncbi:uncharacterized protein E0L32_009579 [Thyridium curvatum]|uniref:Protein kinase domain-containing protein n=1 Tax=Thyridium curvatum TaxID=1093900 RepID=A0A507AXH6_9PEZI|nr:uncharacterized protein E0L32_009579 [Thyridium curvatum]TPX09000.1 hypothetical protein E0L32_009579 [Thyridium curvatum]